MWWVRGATGKPQHYVPRTWGFSGPVHLGAWTRKPQHPPNVGGGGMLGFSGLCWRDMLVRVACSCRMCYEDRVSPQG